MNMSGQKLFLQKFDYWEDRNYFFSNTMFFRILPRLNVFEKLETRLHGFRKDVYITNV